MKERKILIAAILVVTIFGVSVAPNVRRWWRKDAGVMAIAEEGSGEITEQKEDGTLIKKVTISEPTIFYDYANFDEEIKNHKVMEFTLDNYGTIKKNRNYELGSKENPFIVLEIVPHPCYAEFGYLVPGSEPLGFERAEAKYMDKIQSADNLAIRFNSVVTGDPIYAEQEIGYTDYYGNTGIDANGEAYPEGYLAASRVGTVFGKFVKKANGTYQIDGNVENQNIEVTYKGYGGNYDFVPDYTGELYSCFGDNMKVDVNNTRSVPVYNATEEKISEALIFKSVSDDKKALDDKVYAYYDGKYGYFAIYHDVKTPATNPNITLDWENDFWSGITVGKGRCEYSFFEETGVISYFDADAKKATIKKAGESDPDGDAWISYSISTSDSIFASIKCYRPREYYYYNTQKNFFVETLCVNEDEIKDYHVQVLTVTPDVLNDFAEQKDWNLIDSADLISFNDVNHVNGAMKNWGDYYNKNFFSPGDELESIKNGTFKRTFMDTDISWAVAVRLLCKITILQDTDFPYAPVIMPFNCYKMEGIVDNDSPYFWMDPGKRYFADDVEGPISAVVGTINNVVNLYQMIQVFETEEDAYFLNNFIKTGKVVEKKLTLTFKDGSEKKVTTGYFNSIVENEINKKHALPYELDISALYWHDRTFLDVEGVYLGKEEDETHICLGWNNQSDILWKHSNMTPLFTGDGKGSVSAGAVRNNMYTFPNHNAMTITSGENFFSYSESIYNKDPFEIIEFCDRDKLSAFDIMYYLLHQERSSMNVLINGSLKGKIYSNVDYEADNVQMALEVGQIIKKVEDGQERLYGRVQFNVKLNTRKGDENDLNSALVQFNIYRDDIFDDQTTKKLENLIPVTEAYRLTELEKKEESDRVKTRLELGLDYYYDVPLELLEGTVVDGKFKATTTEDVKFSAVVCYGLKDRNQKIGNTEDDYKFKKNIYNYEFEQDENGKITKVKKDERKTLTFVRRAMFNLD